MEVDGRWIVQGDPTEGALIAAARKGGLSPDLTTYPARLDAIPFDSQHQYMATLHAGGVVYIKGAAEILLERCAQTMTPSGEIGTCASSEFRVMMEEIAAGGMRVLAFARLDLPNRQKISHGDITQLTMLGLQGMIDPPRPEAVTAVHACQQAGI